MKKIFFHIMMMAVFIAPLYIAHAQDNQVLRKVGQEEILSKMLNRDRTFWALFKIDRFYFTPDNNLKHQINEPWGNIPLGTVLNAKWNVQNDQLCWKYDDADIQKFGLAKRNLCFDLYTPTSEEEFMVGNHPDIQLKAPGRGASSPSIFSFFSWHAHDYIYDPKYVPVVSKAMDTMAMYREKYNGKIPGGTIRRSSLPPAMQAYHDKAVGKVFAINRDYMYFDPSGDFYWIDGRRIDEANGDVDRMFELADIGTWSMKDQILCWRVSRYSRSCEFIFPYGEGLKNRSFNEIMGTFHTGMTRLHHDTEEDVYHHELKDTEVPELFERFRQTSINARAN